MKSIKFLFVILALLFVCGTAQAQFGKRLGKAIENAAKKTVERKAEQKTEEAVSKGIDKATDPDTYKDKDGNESKKNKKKSSSKKQAAGNVDDEDDADDNTQDTPKGVKAAEMAYAQTVYVAYNDRYDNNGHSHAMLWKNGTVQKISNAWDAGSKSMVVVNNDVYVAGHSTEVKGGKEVATLWKNGVAQKLGNADGEAYSVFVSGNDVYVSGIQIIDDNTIEAILWKNGKAQKLTYKDGFKLFANDVFVDGDNVYVAGGAWNTKTDERAALLWVNGKVEKIKDASFSASAIFVSNGDVYVVGRTFKGNAYLIKNGVEQPLEDNNFDSTVSDVYVAGDDVYVAGRRSKNEEQAKYATLWKNGVAQDLTNGKWLCAAASIFVFGEDVYVSGFDNLTICLWKNGQRQNLPGEAGGALSVFVVK